MTSLRSAPLVALPLVLLIVRASGVCQAHADPPLAWASVGRDWRNGGSADVEMIQYLLRTRGCRLAADGCFGPQTQRQVMRFQRTHGLRVTGVVDGATWRKLVVPVRLGARGDAVRAVQSALDWYGLGVRRDGDFGPRTRRAVLSLQRSYRVGGERQGGIVGLATWNMLSWGSD